MNKLIFFFFFFFFFKASAVEIKNFEALIEEISEKSVEYKLKVSFPSKLYKEIIQPSNRKGEIYIYNNRKKVLFYPSINYILEEEVKKEDDFLKILKDIKEFFEIKTQKSKLRRRNIILQFKDKRLYLIKYPNNTKILLKNYILRNNIYFPQEIEILNKNEKILLNIKEINFNLNFEDKDFEVAK